MKIYQEKESLRKAIDFLHMKNFLPDSPQEVANFLRVYNKFFDQGSIGDFLGEGGITDEQVRF